MEIRHEFIFFYIVLLVLWFLVVTPMMGVALINAQTGSFNNSSVFTNSTSFNESSLSTIESASIWNAGDYFRALFAFNFTFWQLNVLIGGIGAAYGVYVLITFLAPGG